MPGVNLTRAEAQERSQLVKVHSYDVDLDLTVGAENFIVKTRVKFDGLKPGATTLSMQSASQSSRPNSMARHLILSSMANQSSFHHLQRATSSTSNSKASTQIQAKVSIASRILLTERSTSTPSTKFQTLVVHLCASTSQTSRQHLQSQQQFLVTGK